MTVDSTCAADTGTMERYVLCTLLFWVQFSFCMYRVKLVTMVNSTVIFPSQLWTFLLKHFKN